VKLVDRPGGIVRTIALWRQVEKNFLSNFFVGFFGELRKVDRVEEETSGTEQAAVVILQSSERGIGMS